MAPQKRADFLPAWRSRFFALGAGGTLSYFTDESCSAQSQVGPGLTHAHSHARSAPPPAPRARSRHPASHAAPLPRQRGSWHLAGCTVDEDSTDPLLLRLTFESAVGGGTRSSAGFGQATARGRRATVAPAVGHAGGAFRTRVDSAPSPRGRVVRLLAASQQVPRDPHLHASARRRTTLPSWHRRRRTLGSGHSTTRRTQRAPPQSPHRVRLAEREPSAGGRKQ